VNTNLSRRRFLQTTGGMTASALASTSLFGQMSAMAATAASGPVTDYKALVCIFLYGGNDGFNTVISLDPASLSEYLARRANPDIDPATGMRKPGVPASSTNTELNVALTNAIKGKATDTGNTYALHPSLVNVGNLYRSANSKLAVIGNVGPLLAPTTIQAYNSNISIRPPGLFSHSDQQTLWQSGKNNIDSAGWGGRMIDSLQASSRVTNTPYLTVNTSINTNFLYGDLVTPYGLTPTGSGTVRIGLTSSPEGDGLRFLGVSRQKLLDVAMGQAGVTPTNVLEKDYAEVVSRSVTAQVEVSNSLTNVELGMPAPAGRMMRELEVIAKMIKSNAGKPGRQVFFVRHDGYDTHDNQLTTQAMLLGELDLAIKYFHDVLLANNLLNNATLFTASEFGRLLANNGDGTDHGWGGHHFVMGGAVKGGAIYGRVPSCAVTPGTQNFVDPNIFGSTGVLLPEVSTDQYAATLATWFGVSVERDIKSFLPNHFGTTNLGFLKPAA
jgi:uncharacterized protein (DUF1501 family)